MKVIIANGVTVIKTGDPNGGVKNKHNKTGVSHHIQPDGKKRYRAEIQVNRKKHYLGIRDTPEEAASLRLEAEKQIEAGNFEEWIKTIKELKIRNKYNKTGISEFKTPSGKIRYRAEISYKRKRLYLGKRNTLAEIYELIEEAKKHIENDTFEEWLENLRISNSKNKRGKKQ